MCVTQVEEYIWEASGMQLAAIYIGRRQETVNQWVALSPIFEVYEK